MVNQYQPPVLAVNLTSPVGLLSVKASSEGLTHLTVVDIDRKSADVEIFEQVIELEFNNEQSDVLKPQQKHQALQHINKVHQQLTEYFGGKRKMFELSLAPKGTVFQHQVWQALSAMHYGEVCSYSDIANGINRPKAVRAVGAANGANPIAIIVPCHRVIGKSGKLTGYAYGLAMKQFLLALEIKYQN
ncbi:methylated-DNA--[protein]-cysteine S-methyltransferase [Shewanella sp. OMA3-2]|uniref:methylated-DNA--[protein]-cysteine S-methyltransferase n=1 Tax=Shewanella sp. OMA3-2 TaxID=2908650 RepID=UPI001F3E941A|nr:methylated-DNA--[protein]-cysteine S-methyltransferase [Shewanella sp. OMA3-2]UJF23154.1 methylated-DNA--[protein]-cysteine S-methyltransferase [Shewanella sp. OMA3-2]